MIQTDWRALPNPFTFNKFDSTRVSRHLEHKLQRYLNCKLPVYKINNNNLHPYDYDNPDIRIVAMTSERTFGKAIDVICSWLNNTSVGSNDFCYLTVVLCGECKSISYYQTWFNEISKEVLNDEIDDDELSKVFSRLLLNSIDDYSAINIVKPNLRKIKVVYYRRSMDEFWDCDD